MKADRLTGPRTWRLVLPAVGLALLASAIALHVGAHPIYRTILAALIRIPSDAPFTDLEYLLTNATCWRQGVDVYAGNPCDPLGRPMAYSPLWLRLRFLAIDPSWSAPLGVALAVLFCLSLGALPPTRRWRDQIVIGLAAFSSLSVFAVERGNADLLILLSSLIAAWAVGRTTIARAAAYGLLLLAALLKFYPVTALVVLLRERLAVSIGFAVAVLATGFAFVRAFREELPRMAANLPVGSYYTDLIGAIHLPVGIGMALRWLWAGTQTGTVGAVEAAPLILAAGLVLLACAGAAAATLASWPAYRDAVRQLPQRQAAMLMVGAALMCGCFFSGQSVGYRGVLLLLVLPGLLMLDVRGGPGGVRLVARGTIIAILLVMARLVVVSALEARGLAPPVSILAAVPWVGFEVAWWAIISVLGGTLACQVGQSLAWRQALALLQRRETAPLPVRWEP